VPESGPDPYSYAIVRVVPDLERGESLNVGVILFCPARRFLAAKVALDEQRLRSMSSTVDPEAVRDHLDAMVATVDGESRAGRVAAMTQSERFGLLASPSSTILQPSPVHTGLTTSPVDTLQSVFERLVQRGS
jgi:Protein of unknown function (DUF3037)